MRLLLSLAFVLVLWPLAANAQPRAPRYDIVVDLRPADARVRVEGEVRVPIGDAPAEEVLLSINRAFRDVRFASPGVTLSVAPHGGFTDYALRPSRPFPAHRDAVVRFSYVFDPDTRVSYFYSGPEGSFASGVNVAWYPQLVGARPDGVGRVRLQMPAGLTAIVNGRQNARNRAKSGAEVSFNFTRPTAFSFAVGRYHMTSSPGAQPVQVASLTPRAHAAMYAQNVRNLIGFYHDLFVPFPYGAMAVVEVPEAAARRSGFSGQSENGMIWVTSTFLSRHFSWAYYGHEIGHQWWGQLVRKDVDSQSGFYMPDEATAQWAGLQAVAHFEGEAAAERYRRTGYPFYALLQNGLGYLSLVAANQDELLDAPRGGHSHLIANSKGFLVLDHLADTIGRDRFRRALRRYLTEHAFASGSWSDVKAALQAEAGSDLSWFFGQWAARPGAPDWILQWTQNGAAVSGAVTQSAPFYRARLEIETRGPCGVQSHWLDVDEAETAFRFDAPCAMESVTLDPHYRVLRWTPAFHALAEAHAPFARWVVADEYPQLGDEIAQRLQRVPANDPYGLTFALNFDLGRAYVFERRWAESLRAWQAAVASPNAPRDDLPVAFAFMAQAAHGAGDAKTLRHAATAARAAEASASAPTGAPERVADVEAQN